MIEEFQKYQFLLTEMGREELARVIKAFREEYGENWLAAFKAKNPDYVFIIDLAANQKFPDAFLRFKEFVVAKCDGESSFLKRQALIVSANMFLEGAKGDIEVLHGFLKTEIDKPRL